MTVLLISFLAVFATQCKEKEKTDVPSVETSKVELTGTPAQKMTQLMQMGVDALKNSPDAATAASKLSGLLSNYDVAALRAEAKKAKEAGQGATAEEIAAYKNAADSFKSMATEVGAQNPAVFSAVAESWSKAWSLN